MLLIVALCTLASACGEGIRTASGETQSVNDDVTVGVTGSTSNPIVADDTCTHRMSGTVSVTEGGVLCRQQVSGPGIFVDECFVTDPELAADGVEDTAARMHLAAGYNDFVDDGVVHDMLPDHHHGIGIRVKLSRAVAPDQTAAFDVGVNPGLGEVVVLGSYIDVYSMLNGEFMEFINYGPTMTDLPALLGGGGRGLLGFHNSLPYDELWIDLGQSLATLDAGSTLDVYDVCTESAPPGA